MPEHGATGESSFLPGDAAQRGASPRSPVAPSSSSVPDPPRTYVTPGDIARETADRLFGDHPKVPASRLREYREQVDTLGEWLEPIRPDEKWKPMAILFLRGIASGESMKAVLKRLGLSAQAPYRWQKISPEFARAWEEARNMAADFFEAEAIERAIHGVEKPIYYKGEVVGTIREPSDQLLTLLLKGHKPEKYATNRMEGKLAVTGLASLLRT
ncbi:MAG: hypothetical protein D6819_03005, partial [Gammaproteobacteria bacterium]